MHVRFLHDREQRVLGPPARLEQRKASSVWTDPPASTSFAGFSTDLEVPESLVARMIAASTNIGDTVLDPSWVGIRLCEGAMAARCRGSEGRLQKVSVRETNGRLQFGEPTGLPVTIGSGHANPQYDIAPDGRLSLDPTPMPTPTEIRQYLTDKSCSNDRPNARPRSTSV